MIPIIRIYTKQFFQFSSRFALAVALLVAACSSPEEQAQTHYERGMELMAQNEAAKAKLEFQTAVQLNEQLSDAWFQLAIISAELQDMGATSAHLTKVLELNPDHFDARYRLAMFQLGAGILDKALDNANKANELRRDDTNILALRAAVLLRLNDRDGARRDAEQALAINPDNPDALSVFATDEMADGNFSGALLFIDRGLSANPDNFALRLLRLRVFEEMNDYGEVESILRQFIARNQGGIKTRQALIRLLNELGRSADAEIEMRALFKNDPSNIALGLQLIGLINNSKGTDAARTELQTLISKFPDTIDYRLEMAKLDFAQSGVEAARSLLEPIIAKQEPRADVQRAQIVLARILLQSGQPERAGRLIEDILSHDQRNTDALTLRASLRLQTKDTDNAITDLREALSQTPRSVTLLQLLGLALEENGSYDLARARFGQAVRITKFAPAVSLDYSAFLIRRGMTDEAETILSNAISANPGNVALLQALGQVRIRKRDWVGAQAVTEMIKKAGVNSTISEMLLGRSLIGQKKFTEAIETFKPVQSADPEAIGPMLALVTAYTRAGERGKAVNFLNSVLKANENNAEALVLLGTLKALDKLYGEAETAFERAIKAKPKKPRGYIALGKLYMDLKKFDNAQKVLEDGRVAAPDDLGLTLTLASLRQRTNDVDGTIALYDEVVEALGNNTPLIIINNLASLISDYRTDQASLARAAKLSRRLESSDIAIFRDTVGWIAYQEGRFPKALKHLEAVVEQRPKLALARYHLAMVYSAIDRKQDAEEQLTKAADLIAKSDPLQEKIAAAGNRLKANENAN